MPCSPGGRWWRDRAARRADRGKSGETNPVVAARGSVSFARSAVIERQGTHEKLAEVIDLAPVDQFRELVATLPDGVVVLDPEGNIRFVNPAGESLLGRPGRDLVGSPFDIPTDGHEARQMRVTRPDGSEIVLEIVTAPLTWDEESCMAVSLRDVTDRTDFIGIVSHDLRSPMATISGFVDTLSANWSRFDDEHKMRMLDRIGRSTAQLARLVENILHVSQIESGKLHYKITDVDVSELVRRVAGENADPPERISIRVPDDLPSAQGDDIRQWQVLSNLVTNALKFSPADTTVEISAESSGDYVRISVRDEGMGIDPADRDRLFEKFARLDQPDGLAVKGSGLGLYICKAMVEAQGGTIEVDGEPGRGSTFSYTIPTTP